MLDLTTPPFQHLYVHVPFCRRRCTYCDFAISVRRVVPEEAFASAVIHELRMRYDEWQPRGRLLSLYLGGGTPSLLGSRSLRRLFHEVASLWTVNFADLEVTIEVNPDDVTSEAAISWTDLGINRVSVGVQSLQPATLDWMHRTHGTDDALRALDILHKAAVPSTSIDLIFGLPAEARADPLGDLERLLGWWDLTHVSVYGLTVEEGTPLAKWHARGRTVPADEDRYAAEFSAMRACLREHGFSHYEVSNYARPGFMSVHNRGYWNGASFLGVGPSAHSFAGDTRWWNVRHWAEYHQRVLEGADPVGGSERLDSPSRWLETLYLGLRTSDGLDEAVARFLPEETVDRLAAGGLVTVDQGRVAATADGWLRLDEIVTRLTTSSEGG